MTEIKLELANVYSLQNKLFAIRYALHKHHKSLHVFT